MKRYEFNPIAIGRDDRPIINLAYANGFPPETYTKTFAPLMDKYRVVSVHERPLWGDADPKDLNHWSQLGDDLLVGLDELTDKPVIGIGHSVGGVATIYAAIKRPERFSRLVLIEPTMLSPFILFPLWLIRFIGQTPRFGLIKGALRRRDTWPDKNEAFDYFREKRLFKRWPVDNIRTYADSITAPGDDDNVHLTWPREWEAQIYRTLPTGVWSLPRKIKVPFIVIRGELTDTFAANSARTFKLLRPSSKIIEVKGVGHLLPQEKPEEVGKIIADYLG